MPGAKQYWTGPVLTSNGAIALHVVVNDAPSRTATFFAITLVAIWTATCGLDWSSATTNLIGLPAIPPEVLTTFSRTASDCASCDPERAALPVRETMTSISYGEAPRAAGGTAAIDAHKIADIPSAAVPPLDLRQLYYFLRVVECGSFTRAAEELHLAQPAISMAVRKLEEGVGMVLLRREKSGVELTAEGEVLFAHARSILSSVQHARADLDSVRGLKTGSTKIGIPPQFFSAALAARIVEFLDHYPGLRMDLVDAGAATLKKMLVEGHIDLAILSENEIDPGFESHCVLVDELGVVAARGHPLLRYETIDLRTLARYPLAVPSQGFWQRRVLERAFSSGNIRANIRLECSHIDVLKAAVRNSGMVTTMVRGASEDADLVYRSLSPPIEIGGYLCRKPETVLSLANRALFSFFVSRPVIGARR